MDDEAQFPKTHEEFTELRFYLEFLQDELSNFDEKTVTEEQLVSYSIILTEIEKALTLSELYINDNVVHVRDAKSELSRIFNKPIN